MPSASAPSLTTCCQSRRSGTMSSESLSSLLCEVFLYEISLMFMRRTHEGIPVVALRHWSNVRPRETLTNTHPPSSLLLLSSNPPPPHSPKQTRAVAYPKAGRRGQHQWHVSAALCGREEQRRVHQGATGAGPQPLHPESVRTLIPHGVLCEPVRTLTLMVFWCVGG